MAAGRISAMPTQKEESDAFVRRLGTDTLASVSLELADAHQEAATRLAAEEARAQAQPLHLIAVSGLELVLFDQCESSKIKHLARSIRSSNSTPPCT
jgi:hypothetical protein